MASLPEHWKAWTASAVIVITASLLLSAAGSSFAIGGGTTFADDHRETTPDAATDPEPTSAWQVLLGDDTPSDWRQPMKIRFEDPETNDTAVQIFNVRAGAYFSAPDLVTGERYTVIVEDADGDERMLGSYRATDDESVTLRIFNCQCP